MTPLAQSDTIDRNMTKYLSEIAEQELANFRSYQALASVNLQKANAAMERFVAALNLPPDAARPMGQSSIKCVREWTEWLRVNGPHYKSDITEQTGVRFKEQGTPFTIKWYPYLEKQDMSHVPDDTIVRFTGNHAGGRGGAQVIYALWSQRYDVRPKFDVGPYRPGEEPQPLSSATSSAPVLGVVQPALNPPDEGRYLDLDEWELRWADEIAAVRLGEKPSPETRLLMRATTPEGYDPNEVIALAASGRLDELKGAD